MPDPPAGFGASLRWALLINRARSQRMADHLADCDGSHPEAPHLGLVYFAQFVFRLLQLLVIFVSFESEIGALRFEFKNTLLEFGAIILLLFLPNSIHETRITCKIARRLVEGSPDTDATIRGNGLTGMRCFWKRRSSRHCPGTGCISVHWCSGR